VQRAPALCGVWGRVSVASLTHACAMRGDRDSNRDLPVTGGKTLPLAPGPPLKPYKLLQLSPSLPYHTYIKSQPKNIKFRGKKEEKNGRSKWQTTKAKTVTGNGRSSGVQI